MKHLSNLPKDGLQNLIPFITLVLLVLVNKTSGQLSLAWEHTYHGSLAADRGNSIVTDDLGNVYVTGSTDVFGENKNILTIKYNAQGDTIWARKWNRPYSNGIGNGIDEGNAITIDLFHNVYVTGRSQSSGDDFDIVLIKYDANGIMKGFNIFDNQSQFPYLDSGLGIAVDPFGNTYIVGESKRNGILIKYNSDDTPIELKRETTGWVDDIIHLKQESERLIVAGGSGSVLEYSINNLQLLHVYRSHGDVVYGEYYTHAVHVKNNGDVYAIIGHRSDVESEPSSLRIIKFGNGSVYGPNNPPNLITISRGYMESI